MALVETGGGWMGTAVGNNGVKVGLSKSGLVCLVEVLGGRETPTSCNVMTVRV